MNSNNRTFEKPSASGLTERFAREIEAVKTQYPFEDGYISFLPCRLLGGSCFHGSLQILSTAFFWYVTVVPTCHDSFFQEFVVPLMQDLKWKHPCLRLKCSRQI